VITLNYAGAFGPAQDTISAPGADDGIYRAIDMVSDQGTFTALQIKRWESSVVKFKVTDFFVDLSPRNFIQDVGEPTMAACSDLELGAYSIYDKYISYSDDDNTGNFTAGDTILEVNAYLPFSFELTDGPFIAKVKPVGGIRAGEAFRIIGVNFGDLQTTGEVYIGSQKQYNPRSCLGKDCYDGAPTGGKLQTIVKEWSDSKLKVKARFNQSKWVGKKQYVWVVNDGVVSNAKKVSIVAP
jgi:hypothetical protein